jgi:Na+-transporting methylmalonyl-CoA/oxaloacetate decarboxylase gamma subunit
MNNLTFGLTMLVVGMGGTLITLWLLTLVIRGLTALFTALFPPAKDSASPKP